MMASKFNEIEYKYRADKVGLIDFIEFVRSKFGGSEVVKSVGTDHFFSKGTGEFLRYRKGNDIEELTYKRKISKDNNWNRIEVDIPLARGEVEFDAVSKIAELLGLDYKFSIDKANHVIRTDNLVFSYYYVNGADAYIEIEVDKVDQKEEKAFALLKEAESAMKALGINGRNRSNKSLYEIYGGV